MSKRQSTRGESSVKPAPAASSNSVTRAEWIALAVILALGVVHRWLFLQRAAVEHFDEGVYASRVYFILEGGWPVQHLYAPPLVPAVIEWLVIFLGPANLATMLPALVCGSATIALVWWMGRTWFSSAVGLAGALLAATSEIHAVFSRAALTDVPLVLFFLAAVFAWERSVTLRDWRWVVGAGVLTGLAGLTKYNGWLPIGVAGLTGCVVVARAPFLRRYLDSGLPQMPGWRDFALATVGMALLAAALWTPYLWSLNSQGGYAAVAQNHAKYVVGLGGWWESAMRQTLNHRFLEGWLACAGLGGAWLVLCCFPRRQSVPLDMLGQALLLTSAAVWLGSLPVLVLAGVWAIARGKFLASLGGCTAAVAWLLLLTMTPLYHPYARLTLPWLAIAWLLASAGLERLAALLPNPSITKPRLDWLWLFVGIVALILSLTLQGRGLHEPAAWQPRTAMQQASRQFAALIKQHHQQEPQVQPVVFVFAEPAIVFHLYAAGLEIVKPVQKPAPVMDNPSRLDSRVWLVVGPEGERDPIYASTWPKLQNSWELVDTAEVELSDLMLLDLENPRNFAWSQPPRKVPVRLYVWRREASLPVRR